MIKLPDGVILRNLQEQVLQNKEDIAAHYNIDRVLADFGIKIIGQVATEQDLPDPSAYKGDYGDAFAVGATEPYQFFIWTRADVDSGHPNDYWFNIGQIAIIGPQGPQGIQGEKGDKGQPVKAKPLPTLPKSITEIQSAGLDLGDYCLPADDPGKLYYLWGLKAGESIGRWEWQYVVNIIGPKGAPGERGLDGEMGIEGPQGPKGEKGDVGGFININGILASQEQLPDPATLKDLTKAYLVGSASPYDLYVQIGESSDTAIWKNTGPFNGATLVMSGGEAQNVWDADTKVDKKEHGQTNVPYRAAYGYDNKTQVLFTVGYSNSAGANDIPLRLSGGGLYVPTSSISSPSGQVEPEKRVINKGYADDHYVKQFDNSLTGCDVVYGRTYESNREDTFFIRDVPLNGVAGYHNYDYKNYVLRTGIPQEENDAANKNYVDLLHMADDARLDALEDGAIQNESDINMVYQTVKEDRPISEIDSIDSFRTYFYKKRKDKYRHYQFEISNGGVHYDLMSILGYPEGVSTATSLFLYVDIPYSESGGFEIDLTLMGRNTSEFYKRTMHATLDAAWQDSEWYETATKEQVNDTSMTPSGTYDEGILSAGATYTTLSNGYIYVQLDQVNPNDVCYISIPGDLSFFFSKMGSKASVTVPCAKGTPVILNLSRPNILVSLSRFYHAKEV